MSLAPADIEFRPVSHSLIALRLINVVIFMLLLLGGSASGRASNFPAALGGVWAVCADHLLATVASAAPG